MSRLEELIQTLCPDGVEYKQLGSVVKIHTAPQKLNRSQYRDFGQYAIVDQGQSLVIGFTDIVKAILQKNKYVVFGDHTRIVKYIDFPFAQGADGLKILLPKDNFIESKYLYYAFTNLQVPSRGYNRHWSVAQELLIPVPPLPVQEEIVRILDTFSALEAELEKQLEAELAARTKQYDHYRYELMSFNSNSKIVEKLLANICPDGVEYNDLGEVIDILDSQRKPVTKSDRKPGPYPYYGANGIQDYVAGYIFDGIYLLLGEDGSVINPDGSPILTWATGKIWVNNHAHVLSEKNNGALLRYLYYYLQTVDVSKVVRGIPPKINQENLRKIRVALPALEVQEQIVSILDRFDTLVNDLKSGLPAEIALRRKQYECYRDKLLTFPPLK